MSFKTVLEAHGVVLPWGVHCPLSLSVLAGERVGLVGRNGVGKTVLARVLARELTPQAGVVQVHGRVGLLKQRFTCGSEDSVVSVLGVGERWEALQRIYSGNDRPGDLQCVDDDWDLDARVQKVLDGVGLKHVDPMQAAACLSGGEQTRLALAALLMKEPVCVILDEPTNNVDAAGRQALVAWMKSAQVAVLVVSHDRSLLSEVDSIVELSSLGLRRYGGNFNAYLEQKTSEESAAQAACARAQAVEKRVQRAQQQRLEQWAAKQRSGRGKAVKQGVDKITRHAAQERGEATQRSLKATAERQAEAALRRKQEAFSSIEHPVGTVRIALKSCGLSAGEHVLDLKEVSFGFDERRLFEAFSLRIDGPERVAIVGNNGSGKTTLLKLIMGTLMPASGTITVGVPRVAYLDQHVELLDPQDTVLGALQAVNPELSLNACYAGLAQFLFKNKEALRSVNALSGGERVRLGLACVLLARNVPQLIVLDEPTNHLDLASVRSVEAALLDYDGALIVVSHDPAFLKAIGVMRFVVLD